jgi:hypothetical protein
MFKFQTVISKLLKPAPRVDKCVESIEHRFQLGFILSTEIAFSDWPDAAQHPALSDRRIQYANQRSPVKGNGVNIPETLILVDAQRSQSELTFLEALKIRKHKFDLHIGPRSALADD